MGEPGRYGLENYGHGDSDQPTDTASCPLLAYRVEATQDLQRLELCWEELEEAKCRYPDSYELLVHTKYPNSWWADDPRRRRVVGRLNVPDALQWQPMGSIDHRQSAKSPSLWFFQRIWKRP